MRNTTRCITSREHKCAKNPIVYLLPMQERLYAEISLYRDSNFSKQLLAWMTETGQSYHGL